ncbi:hypothetical protein ZIOFF_003152 [Zingiber officinale]|uniref:Molybdate transporter 1 n=1 Tax=Zingiber officinale TaxID=94328 RepID=A0A8J5LT75_ZINOF|nr:hypothetical protein ZIOFF_003152 [Zingiber officinale]
MHIRETGTEAVKERSHLRIVSMSSAAVWEEAPSSRCLTGLLAKARANLHFQSIWAELNGAMGDLGTYIPIVLALALARDLDLGTTLIFTGAYNIITGAIYGVPMPVQPMKSIAAVAISNPSFGIPEIMAAGICTSSVVFFLGATRLMDVVYRLIPLPIVRGIQLSQGLAFAITAVRYVRNSQDLGKGKSLGQRPWFGLDGLVLVIVAAVFIVIVNGAGEGEEQEENLSAEIGRAGDAERGGWAQDRPVEDARGEDLAACVEGRVREGRGAAAAAVAAELGGGGVQADRGLVRGGAGGVGDVCSGDGRGHEPGRVLVRGDAVLPRGGRIGGAVQVRRTDGGLRGSSGGGEDDGRAAAWRIAAAATGGVPSGAAGGTAAIRRGGTGHGGEGHDVEGRVVRGAHLHRRVVGGVERGAGLRLLHGGAYLARAEEEGDDEHELQQQYVIAADVRR